MNLIMSTILCCNVIVIGNVFAAPKQTITESNTQPVRHQVVGQAAYKQTVVKKKATTKSKSDESAKNVTTRAKKPTAKTPLTRAEKIKIIKMRLAKITQNIDNPRPTSYTLLDRRLGISGLANVDANYQTKSDFKKDDTSNIMVSAAKFNFDLNAASWLSGHAGLFAASRPEKYYAASSAKNRLELDEAYVTVANLNRSPAYLRAGRQYLSFGNYHRYPIFKPLTQELSETRALSVQLGYLDFHGLYGTAYALDSATQMNHRKRKHLNNGGAMLGYANLHHEVGLDVGVGYLNNMAGVGIIQDDLLGGYYKKRVAGLSFHGDIVSGPFDFGVRYVTALRSFNVRDFAYQERVGNIRGAKPKAGTLKAGYKFKTKGHDSEFIVSYQRSYQAYNMSNNASSVSRIPRKRIAAGYGVNVWQHLILGCELTRDRDYTKRHGGTNRISNTATIRASLYF